ncbi:dipeptide/oligopeptide/nickel ABC transporter ATP-binding protein [Leucobacter allii]|uniref:ATP-binding cassette domain-containing protein n=1 Tax=Leucobacter allii TaxID=2932247 RepID=UPI001FD4BC8F|nr:dipeptide/oligopeptide/nickel ABC transporter ATP-binding protein [Leucobacter allii]UOR02378.1 dipeptide/oligopeptide/nickel ABC transporter ATP-binding protein [Leucobacter allii]
MTTLLEVKDLVVEYPVKGWRTPAFRAVDGVSFALEAGRTLGVVGESGSGKSTIGRSILGLAPVTSGSVSFEGRDLARLDRATRRSIAKEIQVVFQDPYSSLNPSMTIGEILREPLDVHFQDLGRSDAHQRITELLDLVRLPSDAVSRLPHEFSGGQRQRIAIARALALRPRLVICDEPVSALDLTTQVHVLELFYEIQRETGVSYLFVTHDLDVVRHICHDVLVMRAGKAVEQGETMQIVSDPENDYTRRLLLSSPSADPDEQRERREQLASL